MSPLRAVAAMLVVATLGAACATGEDDSASTEDPPPPVEHPGGEVFYDPGDVTLAGPHGSLIRYHPMEVGFLPEARAWKVAYRSRSVRGEPTMVTGMVVAPGGPVPDEGFPVVSWAHPTDGAGDKCAPSTGSAGTILGLRRLVEAGFVVAATDYEGLGTPGIHPYLVGASEAHAVIDIALAADDLPGVSTSSAVLFWGYSQGGHAVVFAAQQAADYAPDLTVEGTVAVAPASDLHRLVGGDDGRPPLPGVALLILGTWAEAYDLDPRDVLTADAADQVDRFDEQCDPLPLVADAGRIVATPVPSVDAWAALVEENTPGRAEVQGPVLLVQGGEDQLLDPEAGGRLFRRLCRRDATVELRRFPDAGHGVALQVTDAVARWLAHRHEGEPAANECGGG